MADSTLSVNLTLDGEAARPTPRARRHGDDVWVPLEPFCMAVGAIVKNMGGRLAVCDEDGDVCILLGEGDHRELDGTGYGRLDAFARPLGLTWAVTADGVLAVTRAAATAKTGLGVGERPPAFALPDIDTGQLVSADVVLDRPAVFYMWASW